MFLLISSLFKHFSLTLQVIFISILLFSIFCQVPPLNIFVLAYIISDQCAVIKFANESPSKVHRINLFFVCNLKFI